MCGNFGNSRFFFTCGNFGNFRFFFTFGNSGKTRFCFTFGNTVISRFCFTFGNTVKHGFSSLCEIRKNTVLFHKVKNRIFSIFHFLKNRCFAVASLCEKPLYINIYIYRGITPPKIYIYKITPTPTPYKISNFKNGGAAWI